MNKLAIGVAGFVVVLAGGMIFLQQQSLAELRGEVAALRGEVARIDRPAAAATVSANSPAPAISSANEEGAELAKLRDQMKALDALVRTAVQQTQKATGLAQAAAQSARGESPIPVKLTPAGDLKNVGRATASAAVETVLAAAYGGDVDALTSAIQLEPSAQAKADELFASLPEATQAQYGSPDKLVALMLAKDASALSGMQVLGQRDLSADTVGVRVRLATEDGKTKEQGLAFQKTTDGLRLRIPDDLVAKYAKQLGAK